MIGLHIHAASYFETTEQWPEAIHHYLRAGLQRQAARLIAKYGEDLVSEGRLGLVDEWLLEIPREAIRQNARLSLLFGETSGIRGDQATALEALHRAREYFVRKGDKRLEALACLKLSSVYSNSGDTDRAATAAEDGAAIVPHDDVSTRLRLEGNLAITRTWSTGRLSDVVRECRRIAVEAAMRGLDHFATIAIHNAGAIHLRMGQLDEALADLERASAFWSGTPTSPFMDNDELVSAYLAKGKLDQAMEAAKEGLTRTRPWPRPQVDAQLGYAKVLVAQSRHEEALTVLAAAAANRTVLGAMHRPVFARLVECHYAAGRWLEIPGLRNELLNGPDDLRYSGEVAPALAIATHVEGKCRGECQAVSGMLVDTNRRGASYSAAVGAVKLAVLALDHGVPEKRRAWEAVVRAQIDGYLGGLQWWTRRFARHADIAVKVTGGVQCVLRLLDDDPEGWRASAVDLIEHVEPNHRPQLLQAIVRNANRETPLQLARIEGTDVQTARRRLQVTQAARLFVRTFGGVSIHRGDWDGPEVMISKRRARSLLGVLAAHVDTRLLRDRAIDLLWPDADGDSAVNSLNQTVFQLRRYLDPSYRAGESPEYIESTSDHVGLSRELIRTDLQELRRFTNTAVTMPWARRQAMASRLVSMIRGEFLADLSYETWASSVQVQVHNEVRRYLLPIASAKPVAYDVDVALRAASALVLLDPYDEQATMALAEALSLTGRKVSARRLLVDYANRVRSELGEEVSTRVGIAAEHPA